MVVHNAAIAQTTRPAHELRTWLGSLRARSTGSTRVNVWTVVVLVLVMAVGTTAAILASTGTGTSGASGSGAAAAQPHGSRSGATTLPPRPSPTASDAAQRLVSQGAAAWLTSDVSQMVAAQSADQSDRAVDRGRSRAVARQLGAGSGSGRGGGTRRQRHHAQRRHPDLQRPHRHARRPPNGSFTAVAGTAVATVGQHGHHVLRHQPGHGPVGPTVAATGLRRGDLDVRRHRWGQLPRLQREPPLLHQRQHRRRQRLGDGPRLLGHRRPHL